MQHNYLETIIFYIQNIWSKCLMFIREEHMHFFFLACLLICNPIIRFFPVFGLTCVIIFFTLQMYNIYYNWRK
jgi:hypothetical protein